MEKTKPAYMLRELIYKKYGEAKFAVGCEIVARFVGFKSTEEWTMEKVLYMCNTGKLDVGISNDDGKKFIQLFGLQSIEDLFTNKTTQHAISTATAHRA